MADEMSAKQIPLTIIVAATLQNGIGKNGALPWPMLRKEMQYFARVTKRIPTPADTGSVQSDALKSTMLEGSQRNVVIMGRKTWDSIPPKFRPLKERTNIVISSQSRHQLNDIRDDIVVAPDLASGLDFLVTLVKAGTVLPPGRAFVIGGSSIYNAALDLPQTKHILLTRIHKDYECDTFFSVGTQSHSPTQTRWEKKSHEELSKFVSEEVPKGIVSEQGGDHEVQFEYQLFERS